LMIVPSMTLPEIRKSVDEDYISDIKNKVASVEITSKGKWVRNGRKDFVETILVPSKSRNNWRITIKCDKNGVTAMPYLISWNDVGINATHMTFDYEPPTLLHFRTH